MLRWQQRLGLPECHYGPSSATTTARFREKSSAKPKDRKLLTTALAPLARHVPVVNAGEAVPMATGLAWGWGGQPAQPAQQV